MVAKILKIQIGAFQQTLVFWLAEYEFGVKIRNGCDQTWRPKFRKTLIGGF